MSKPKEIWLFSNFDFEIFGPCPVIGETDEGTCWKYRLSHSKYDRFIAKSQTILTRRQAVEACYKYHNKRIKQEQEKLKERERLLKRFYAEEYYE